jgi:hypothetical protein
MKIQYSCFTVCKEGETPVSNRDAYYPKKKNTWDKKKGNTIFAISDGATQSYLSGKWAETLVNIFKTIRFSPNNFKEKILAKSSKDWVKFVQDYQTIRELENRPLKWYELEGIDEGAYATLVVLTIHPPDIEGIGEWESIARGDSCLFYIHKNEFGCVFPLEKSTEFNNTPPLLSSLSNMNSKVEFVEKRGFYYNGDVLYLMTDALAAWFLREKENNNKPWEIVDNNSIEQVSFTEWIKKLRIDYAIENDDVTLLRIEFFE